MLDAMLRRRVRKGNLTVRQENGREGTYGDGSGPPVTLWLSDAAARSIAVYPPLRFGEAYMDGGLRVERGTIWDLLEIAGRNISARLMQATVKQGLLTDLRKRLRQWNHRRAALRNVAHHYDLSIELYRRFLDEDLQYSCAYFARPDMTLEAAQAAKKAHIAAKLALHPSHRVLDIGCGWGGMAITLARDFGCEVLGVTLSEEQIKIARERAAAAGVADRVKFELKDYRDVKGPFDRIVSVGMFEHVGLPNYQAFFDRVNDLLGKDGVALIHAIGRRQGPGMTQAWVRKYIFPGGYIPALSEVTPAVERSGLWITDVEIWRLHYAETLRCWRERFAAHRDEVAGLYDERFCRMWEFYLAISELAFRYMGHMVFQVQLVRDQTALPLTRDYMIHGAAGRR